MLGTDPSAAVGSSPIRSQLPAGRDRRVAGRWGFLSVVAGLAAAAAFVLRFNPTDRVTDPTGACTWHSLFGINGPGCGGTRMFWYLLHGDIIEAARHHLVALAGVPFALYALVQWGLASWLGLRLPPLRLPVPAYITYGVVWMLYAVVLRNLPWVPFTWFDIPQLTK